MYRVMVLSHLIAIAARHNSPLGLPTIMPRLIVRSANAPTDPTPALFEPKFYLLLQGAKRMTIAGDTFPCGPGTCAVAAVGLPFVSEVTQASADRPYLGIELKLDAGIVAGLLLDVPDRDDRPNRSITIASVDASVAESLERLLRLLDTPGDLPVLGPHVERELYYRLLQGPMGGTLRQIGRGNTRFAQIRQAVDWISANADKPMRVDALAASVGMSLTSFHRHFKAITSYSPLAYQRHIRLLDGRRRLASGTLGVTQTAFATGYASAPQFSREYKRAFGVPPSRDAASLR
jgi:AraC-like DNA-binding protein